MSKRRIKEWYDFWEGNVYVSFSGGKDSTVLLTMARELYPNISAVFIDTGLEYPEIRSFVKTFEEVTWLKPTLSFRDVIKQYGYPVISKEVSRDVSVVKNNPNSKTATRFDPQSEHSKRYGQQYCRSRYSYLIDAPFKIHARCCDVMKKSPAKKYEKESGNHPIVGTMASESKLRKNAWEKNGCNAFDSVRPISQPLSFWTEQDVLGYLFEKGVQYCKAYGEIINNGQGQYHTTGVKRTGCMFCMFGCHLDKEPNRFQMMKTSHPKQYEYCMRNIEDGGLGLRKVLEYIGVKYE
jgi:3'-phosphoadenosine 5'-phosphosulfate sulfotransferase (PAPS reductase)/FAD synthetase